MEVNPKEREISIVKIGPRTEKQPLTAQAQGMRFTCFSA